MIKSKSFDLLQNRTQDYMKIKKSTSFCGVLHIPDMMNNSKTKKPILRENLSFKLDNNLKLFSSSKYDQEGNKLQICKTCKKTFYTCCNYLYCSLQCHKNSKKDVFGYFHTVCYQCKQPFITKCIFTDFCSNECFDTSKSGNCPDKIESLGA
jgi:hypothetical protein